MKMNFLCIILILFALVNVLAALDDYLKQVYMLNHQMFNTKADLPKVIQNLIIPAKYTIVELVLMFAVPEAEDKDVEDYINQQKLEYQETVQEQIWCLTLSGPPPINTGEFSKASLIDLGKTRRSITLETVKTLIRDVLCGNNTNFPDFYNLCRLIALFRSIKQPDSFIVLADLDERDARVCYLVDMNRNASTYYNIEGNIWEYEADGTPKEVLSSQVK